LARLDKERERERESATLFWVGYRPTLGAVTQTQGGYVTTVGKYSQK
jgi:hypothetical protein